MEPISSADQLVILLRQKLRERAKTAGKDRAAPREKGAQEPVGRSTIQALAAVDGVDDGQLRRALVQNLLAEHLGQDLINDAQFQQIVSRVTGAIEEDADACGLIARVLSELRTP